MSEPTNPTIVETMSDAARKAGAALVTGDTKVVDRGHGDGVYINTSGFGLVPPGVSIAPHLARPGDVVILSGEIGLHGIAVMSVRVGLAFDTVVKSDTAPLNGLVAAMLEATTEIHVLRLFNISFKSLPSQQSPLEMCAMSDRFRLVAGERRCYGSINNFALRQRLTNIDNCK